MEKVLYICVGLIILGYCYFGNKEDSKIYNCIGAISSIDTGIDRCRFAG